MPDKVIAGMNDSDLLKLIKETHDKLHENEKRKEEFTISEWGQINGISYNLARRELEKLEKDKIVLKRNFGRILYWSFANEDS